MNQMSKLRYEQRERLIDRGINPFISDESQAAVAAAAGTSQQSPNISQFYNLRTLKCNVCNKQIDKVEYHCTICNDYDLCENCFQSKRRNNNHQLSHPMIRGQSVNTNTNFADLTKFTLDVVIQRSSKLQYNEDEKCCFCSARLKGLCFNIDKTNRFCHECYRRNAFVSFGSPPIYIQPILFCCICFKEVKESYFVCQVCKSEYELGIFGFCAKCCLNGAETEQHKATHPAMFIKYTKL